MIAISLWQPWASALFALRPDGRPLKPDETRHWPLPARLVGKEVAIHAAKRNTKDEQEFWTDVVLDSPHRELYGNAFKPLGVNNWKDLPRGCIVGTVVFAPCWKTTGFMDVEEVAREWGNYGPDRYGWPTVTRKYFDLPVPCIGRQGFFEWPSPDHDPASEPDLALFR